MKKRPWASQARSALAAGGCVLVLAACGGGGGDNAGAPVSPTAEGAAVAYATNAYSQQVPAQPLTLTVEADSARAVTQRISAAQGGSLRVSGADGASFEFTVPADAPTADLEVTMTPIAPFTRLPFNGSDAALVRGSSWSRPARVS